MGNYDIAYIFKAIDEFSPALKKINTAMDNFDKKMDKAQKKVGNFSAAVSKAGSFMFKAFVAPLAGAVVYSMKNADQLERMQIRLESVAGSAENAAQAFALVKKFSLTTGLAPEMLTDMSTKLLAVKTSMADLPEKMRQMTMFAVVAGDKYPLVESALTKMRATGGATSRILTSLAKAGIPLIQALGLSTKGLQLLKGKVIDMKVVEAAFAKMTKEGSDFSNAYQKMLLTSGTSMDRLHNAFRIISADFGKAFMKVFDVDGKLASLADHMDELEPKFEKWLERNRDLIKMGTYIFVIVTALSAVARSIVAIRLALLALAANPIVFAILTAIVAAGKALTAISNIQWKSLPGEFKQMASMVANGKGMEALKMTGQAVDKAAENTSMANVATKILGGKQTSDVNVNAQGHVVIAQPGQPNKKVPLTFNTGTSTVGAQ